MEQGSKEWHASRAGKATASRFSDVMSFKKDGNEMAARRDYRTQVAIERLTGKHLDGYVSFAMREGTEREPLARAAFEATTGLYVSEVPFIEHPDLLAGCSPDGLIGEASGVEIKCPQPTKHFEYLSLPAGGVPEEYLFQVQGSMWITGRPEWYFTSFNPDFPGALQLVVRRVARDEKIISALSVGVEKFLEEVEEAFIQALNFKGAVNV